MTDYEAFWKWLQRLCLGDKKDLTQMSLKVAEECGELAQAVLSYTEAPGNAWRKKDKAAVLEEACDVLLCAYATIRKLGASDMEMTRMLEYKMGKWEAKQIEANTVVTG